MKRVDVWVVVLFTYPEWDTPGEFDGIVGIYTTREDAEEVKSRHPNSEIHESLLYTP